MHRNLHLFSTDPDLSWRWKKVVGSKENTAEWKHALICERHFDPSVSFEFYQVWPLGNFRQGYRCISVICKIGTSLHLTFWRGRYIFPSLISGHSNVSLLHQWGLLIWDVEATKCPTLFISVGIRNQRIRTSLKSLEYIFLCPLTIPGWMYARKESAWARGS